MESWVRWYLLAEVVVEGARCGCRAATAATTTCRQQNSKRREGRQHHISIHAAFLIDRAPEGGAYLAPGAKLRRQTAARCGANKLEMACGPIGMRR